MLEICGRPHKTCLYGIILYDTVVTSKIIFIVIAAVVTVMVSAVIAASLGTQGDVPEAADPKPTRVPSETLGTVNGTSDTLTEPQGSASQTTEPTAQPEEFEVVDTVVDKDITKSNLPKVVDVGMLIPGHGTWTDEGIIVDLGNNDFNNYLEEMGAPWRTNFIWKDSQSHPIDALEVIQQLDSEGVKFVVGKISSAEVRHVKSYVDSNDMVLISSVSSATSLAVVDNIFRFSPDSSQQSKVLSLLFEQEGIEVVIPIYRGDDWGDSVYKSTKNSFEALGGVMDDGVRYSSEATAYSAEAALLSDLVEKYTNQYHADKVAVLMIGFSETVHLLGSAASFDNLDSVRWFGSAGSSLDNTLSADPVASTFLQDVNFVSTLFGTSRNNVYANVQEYFTSYTGSSSPDVYLFSLYDSIWVLGKTILETDSIDPLTVRDAITDVASRHAGAIGTINLNEFGDFATPNYDLWSIRDGAWYKSGYFAADSGTFSFT